MGKVIAITNQKGGVGKTVTTMCLGVCLAQRNKKVLLVDMDSQGNLTKGLGYRNPNSYSYSLKDAIYDVIQNKELQSDQYIVHSKENVDILPANINLSGIDLQLSTVMSRETILKRILEPIRNQYDYILIDSNPALNLFTINTLTVADSVIIPVQAEPYATDGLTDLIQTIKMIRNQLNPNLTIDGILITMTDGRTILSKHISNEIRSIYESHINVFKTQIPRCVKTAEAALSGESPILYSPKSDSTIAYIALSKEVLRQHEKAIAKAKHESVR